MRHAPYKPSLLFYLPATHCALQCRALVGVLPFRRALLLKHISSAWHRFFVFLFSSGDIYFLHDSCSHCKWLLFAFLLSCCGTFAVFHRHPFLAVLWAPYSLLFHVLLRVVVVRSSFAPIFSDIPRCSYGAITTGVAIMLVLFFWLIWSKLSLEYALR